MFNNRQVFLQKMKIMLHPGRSLVKLVTAKVTGNLF